MKKKIALRTAEDIRRRADIQTQLKAFMADIRRKPMPQNGTPIWVRRRLDSLEVRFEKAKAEIGNNEYFRDLCSNIEMALGRANAELNFVHYKASPDILASVLEAINASIEAALGFMALTTALEWPKSTGRKFTTLGTGETEWDALRAEYAKNPQRSAGKVYDDTVRHLRRDRNLKLTLPRSTVIRWFKKRVLQR